MELVVENNPDKSTAERLMEKINVVGLLSAIKKEFAVFQARRQPQNAEYDERVGNQLVE